MTLCPPHPCLSHGRGGAATDSGPEDTGEDSLNNVEGRAWSAAVQIDGASTAMTQGPSGRACMVEEQQRAAHPRQTGARPNNALARWGTPPLVF